MRERREGERDNGKAENEEIGGEERSLWSEGRQVPSLWSFWSLWTEGERRRGKEIGGEVLSGSLGTEGAGRTSFCTRDSEGSFNRNLLTEVLLIGVHL